MKKKRGSIREAVEAGDSSLQRCLTKGNKRGGQRRRIAKRSEGC